MAVVREHLSVLRWRNYSEQTVYQRGRALRRLADHAARPPEDCAVEDVRRFLMRSQRTGKPLAPASSLAELAHLAGFYKWMLIEGRRGDDPTATIPRPKVPRGVPRPISEERLVAAIRCAPERVHVALMLAAFAGLRASEIAGLCGEHVDWSGESPRLLVDRSKGGDQHVLPVCEPLAEVLRHAPRVGPVVPRLDGRPGTLRGHNVSAICNAHLHSLGLSDTLHTLRHRFGTQVFRTCRDIRMTQELMRHRSILSTQIYTAVDQDEKMLVVESLPAA